MIHSRHLPAHHRAFGTLVKEYLLILLGSILYGVSTVFFLFPHDLMLGGTSGIAVILHRFLPFSPGVFSVTINSLLIVVAFIVLGKSMATKTLVGSLLTTVSIGLLDGLSVYDTPFVSNIYASALIGAAMIAIASGIMFYVASSSGGTDIVALIVQKYARIHIGRALLLTDILIVLVGGALLGVPLLISSFIGLLVKTLGIDMVIALIRHLMRKPA